MVSGDRAASISSAALLADRGYDAEPHRRWLRALRIRPQITRRRTPHGSGLGKQRWVV